MDENNNGGGGMNTEKHVNSKIGLAIVGAIAALIAIFLVFSMFQGDDGSDALDSATGSATSTSPNLATWKMFGKDATGSRYQEAETEISKNNVANLAFNPSLSAPTYGMVIKNPAADEEALYLADIFTGEVKKVAREGSSPSTWSVSLIETMAEPACGGEELLYATSFSTPSISGDSIIIGVTTQDSSSTIDYGNGAYVVALDKKNGACQWATQVTDFPSGDLAASPTVQGNTVYTATSSNEESLASDPNYECCKFIGEAIAIDVNSGELLWKTPMVDPKGDPSTTDDDLDSIDGYSGVAIWSSSPVVIQSENLVVYTTGNAYSRGEQIEPEELNPFQLSVNSLVAIDTTTGEKRWVHQYIPADYWNLGCVQLFGRNSNCPENDEGPDFDFGAGATLVKNVDNVNNIADSSGTVKNKIDIIGASSKSGYYVAVEATTGTRVWDTQIGPSSILGLNGSSTDGELIYATAANTMDFDTSGGAQSREWTLVNGPHAGEKAYGGIVTALNPASGEIVWQNTSPVGLEPTTAKEIIPGALELSNASILAPTSVANGVVYTGIQYPDIFLASYFGGPFYGAPGDTLFGFDAETGEILWSENGGPVVDAPTIVDGVVYWGGFGGSKAFSLQ